MAKKAASSPLIRQALDRIAELRAEHREIVEMDYRLAEFDTNGVLLNRRGKNKGIDPFSLFTHNQRYFEAYASEELREWRLSHPRVTFADYERMMTEEPF